MGYRYEELERTAGRRSYPEKSLEGNAIRFIRDSCEGLRFSGEKEDREREKGEYLGTSLKAGQIPYNMQMDIDRLCFENAIARFFKSGRKEDAFDVYFCYLEMFIGDYAKTRRMIELLSEYEANGSALLMKHRDHYSHSVYVFLLGIAIYQSNGNYRKAYKNYCESHYKDCRFADGHEEACHYLRYWGLTSLFHDIGYPFELPFEQVCSYFEVDDDDRGKRPFVAYRGLESFVGLDKKAQRMLSEVCGVGTDKILRTTDELFAHALYRCLGERYYFSEEEMLETLRGKPVRPDQFSHFMDHAYFSATVLFKKLFCELDCELQAEHIDALTAILLHNSLYKFSVAYYKDKSNIPLRAEWHPLAYMLMLCDELQCWDRTAYGRNSRREFHPMNCGFTLTEEGIGAKYLYDKKERPRAELFEADYREWSTKKKGKAPGLKAYSEMYVEKAGEVSKFQEDIGRILDLRCIGRLSVVTDFEDRSRTPAHLSDSSYISLYRFATILNGRWSRAEEWGDWTKEEQEKFLSDKKNQEQFMDDFKKLSLEYKLSNINQAKAFDDYLSVMGAFYTDRAVDFEMLEGFSEKDLDEIGWREHKRWLQEHYDMGWAYVQPDSEAKKARELRRHHWDMLKPEYAQDWDGTDVTDEQARRNYEDLSKGEKNKDKKPMECMLAMLKLFDGIRVYKLR